MTVNKAYLVATGATVTSNNMPVMTPETFLGLIRWFPGPFLIDIFIF